MYGPLLLFLLLLVPTLIVLRGRDWENCSFPLQRGTWKNFFAVLLLVVLSVSVLVVEIPGAASEKRKVVLYDKGFLNWQVPSFKMFGSRSAGMFGNLPRFLAAMGFKTEKVGIITAEVLRDAKILVMINVDKEIGSQELDDIWAFVSGGGSLLLLGDHTFYKHEVKRIILNDILQPFSIRYNFDSADWFVGGWLYSYQYASHPITVGMRDDMNDAGSVIGASLHVQSPAFPLVIGKYGYSDPGVESSGGQRGYLGNLNYDPGEHLGDVVLCAGQYFGKGKLLVFGDTSAFANAILVNSHNFVNRVFTWLSRDESPKRYRLALVLASILLACALFVYLKGNRVPLVLVVSLVSALLTLGSAEYLKQHNAETLIRGKIAYVDASHGERFSPESWNEDAILGLQLNLMRNGYLSFTLRSFDRERIEQAKLLVLIAPSAPFSNREIGWIDDFVKKGGLLFISVGWEERAASVSLLEHFGFSVENRPLSQFVSVISYANQKVRFYEAWPVMNTEGEVVAAYQTFPVIMKRKYGKGYVVLIGDSSFFWNKNLEMEKSHVTENVEFLRWFLNVLAE